MATVKPVSLEKLIALSDKLTARIDKAKQAIVDARVVRDQAIIERNEVEKLIRQAKKSAKVGAKDEAE